MLLLADQEKLGEEMKGTPLISSTSNLTLTQQTTMESVCVCVSVRVLMAHKCLIYQNMITNIFVKFCQIVWDQWSYLHICSQCVFMMSGRHSSTCYGKRVWPAWPFTHPTTCSAQLLCARKVRRDTIATLIDWVNKYSVSVPVRIANILSVCFHLQRITVTSCLPCFCELMNDRGFGILGETRRNHVWEDLRSCITCAIF